MSCPDATKRRLAGGRLSHGVAHNCVYSDGRPEVSVPERGSPSGCGTGDWCGGAAGAADSLRQGWASRAFLRGIGMKPSYPSYRGPFYSPTLPEKCYSTERQPAQLPSRAFNSRGTLAPLPEEPHQVFTAMGMPRKGNLGPSLAIMLPSDAGSASS
jgi:hypothetical protein